MASNNSNISAADIFRILEENPELKVESIEMPLGARIVWDILFGGMLFVAVVGNLIVLWIVIGKLFQVSYKSHYQKYHQDLSLKLSFDHNFRIICTELFAIQKINTFISSFGQWTCF